MGEWRTGRDAAMDAAEALWLTLYRHLNSTDGDASPEDRNTAGPNVRALCWGSGTAWRATEAALQAVLVAILTDDGLTMPDERAARVRELASDSGEGPKYALASHLANDVQCDYGAACPTDDDDHWCETSYRRSLTL